MTKKINSALISVFNKDGLEEIVKLLERHNVKIISTGGTAEFIRKLGVVVTEVETITNFPAVFGGRVKTLQPKIFGGILNRRDNEVDKKEKAKHKIEDIDLVIVDLYPFEETLANGETPEEIIEKIDIGGIALIRAAAKNFNDVVVIPSKNQYQVFCKILEQGAETSLEQRKKFAGNAFEITSKYDSAIRGYFQNMPKRHFDTNDVSKCLFGNNTPLRYGENPHQKAEFVGNLEDSFIQLQGKELSYNNLIDTEAAITLVCDFKEPAFAIIKHMNACGLSVQKDIFKAYKAAYNADPLSAFGGILAANRPVGEDIVKLKKNRNFLW